LSPERITMEDLALALKSALPIDDIDRLIIDPADGIALVWVDIQESRTSQHWQLDTARRKAFVSAHCSMATLASAT